MLYCWVYNGKFFKASQLVKGSSADLNKILKLFGPFWDLISVSELWHCLMTFFLCLSIGLMTLMCWPHLKSWYLDVYRLNISQAARTLKTLLKYWFGEEFETLENNPCSMNILQNCILQFTHILISDFCSSLHPGMVQCVEMLCGQWIIEEQ